MHLKNLITVTAVVFIRDDERVLLVRKNKTEAFMFSGGKPEAGEEPVATGVREVSEELGVVLNPDDLEYVGAFSTVAANEADTELRSQVFLAPPEVWAGQTPQIQAEIIDSVWVDPAHPQVPTGYRIAPLAQQVLGQLAAAH